MRRRSASSAASGRRAADVTASRPGSSAHWRRYSRRVSSTAKTVWSVSASISTLIHSCSASRSSTLASTGVPRPTPSRPASNLPSKAIAGSRSSRSPSRRRATIRYSTYTRSGAEGRQIDRGVAFPPTAVEEEEQGAEAGGPVGVALGWPDQEALDSVGGRWVLASEQIAASLLSGEAAEPVEGEVGPVGHRHHAPTALARGQLPPRSAARQIPPAGQENPHPWPGARSCWMWCPTS